MAIVTAALLSLLSAIEASPATPLTTRLAADCRLSAEPGSDLVTPARLYCSLTVTNTSQVHILVSLGRLSLGRLETETLAGEWDIVYRASWQVDTNGGYPHCVEISPGKSLTANAARFDLSVGQSVSSAQRVSRSRISVYAPCVVKNSDGAVLTRLPVVPHLRSLPFVLRRE
jgi:hypothetical protein